jgi:hypothetical protein
VVGIESWDRGSSRRKQYRLPFPARSGTTDILIGLRARSVVRIILDIITACSSPSFDLEVQSQEQ